VTPARIAREFGISNADVRSALTGNPDKPWAAATSR